MKVLALVLLVVASAAARGSGPYLPSGWRPAGPAFYLPTEVQKPVAVPLKDAPVQESSSDLLKEYSITQEEETSGSDALREYGPPKVEEVAQIAVVQEVSQDFTQQALPQPITEQAFVIIETKVNEEADSAAQEEVTEKVEAVAATDAELEVKEQTTEAVVQGKSLEIESQTESSLAVQEEIENEVTEKSAELTEKTVEEEVTETAEVQEDAVSNLVAAVEQRSEGEVAEVKVVEEGVKNIAEALVGLENEIKAQQVQEITEAKSVQEISGSVQQGPAGFLEYGPPGFTEYGPPLGEPRAEEQPILASFDSNETRRRRFSPKFKASRKH